MQVFNIAFCNHLQNFLNFFYLLMHFSYFLLHFCWHDINDLLIDL